MSKIRIHGHRYQLIGDMLSALPILYFYEKKYPGSFKSWGIAKKCAQAAPIFINHPLINQIFIFDGLEGPESQRDFGFIKSHDIIINGNPDHPDSIYPSQRTIYLETFLMAGLTLEDWNTLTPDEQRPKLYKWWKENPKRKNTIAYWPQAGYGVENKRNASLKWRQELVLNLAFNGFEIWQFGSEKDDILSDNPNIILKRFNNLSFFEQIKLSLECELVIGTDSGSQLILGAYGVPQISLLTNHWREDQDPHALEVNNPNNYSFWVKGGCDNIKVDEVVAKVKDMVK